MNGSNKMAFYNSRGKFSSYPMILVDVEVKKGKAAWVHSIVATFKDEGGTVAKAYGAAFQGQAKKELGENLTNSIGQQFVVNFGVNCQVTAVKLIKKPIYYAIRYKPTGKFVRRGQWLGELDIESIFRQHANASFARSQCPEHYGGTNNEWELVEIWCEFGIGKKETP
jgi:hypothetical protein